VYATVHVTKGALDRPRPPDPLAGSTLSSFPSGHAAYSTVYVALAIVAARVFSGNARRALLVVAALVLAYAIGASRAYLRVHWWSDVLAGWALGAAIFGLVAAVALVVGYFRDNGEGESAPAPSAGTVIDRA
jgi:membrane-associated phospholipid phosphatase